MRQRAIKLLRIYLILGGLGFLYAVIVWKSGAGIPCIIRTVTGLRCPGCGITHMSMELLQGHLKDAFYSNRAVFLLLPVFLLLWIRYIYRYIRRGTTRLAVMDNVLIGISIVALIAWGIIRNLPSFQYLN